MRIDPLTGAIYLIRGIGLLGAPGIKRFVVVPLAINIVVFSALLWFAFTRFDALVTEWTSSFPAWIAWIAWLVFALAAVVAVFFTFTIVANLISAPFNSLLAEAVERHLSGQPPPGDGGFWAVVKEAPGQFIDEFRKLGYYLRFAIPLLILFVIPVANLVAPFLWALFGAWMVAVQYADYPLGNRGMRAVQQRKQLGEARLLALGFGGATMVATMIPIVNFLVMPAAVAGATALVVERFGRADKV